MTVLDTFYLLFKTDAKGAQNDISTLNKQISELAAKGKSRNDAEIKELKELRKQRAEQTRDLKDQAIESDKLGQSFVKTIENAAAAGTALFAFTAIKSGVQHVTDFNAALRTTAGLTGASSRDLAILGAAAEHAGGTQEGAVAQYQSLFDKFKSAGLPTPDPLVLIQRLQQKFAGKTPQAQAFLAGQIGISDPGWLALGRQSPDQLRASIAQGQGTQLTEDQQKKLFDLRQSERDALQEVDHWLGVLGSDLSTYIVPALKLFGDALHTISNTPGGPETEAGVGVVAGWFGTKWAARTIGKWLGIGKNAAPAAAEIAEVAAGASAATIGAIIVGGLAAAGTIAYHKEIADWIDNKLNGNAASSGGNQSAIGFWQSKGYSRQQAAAWAAQEQSESSGDPRAFNQGHYGLYQWSEKRRQNIIAGLGIDVATASAADQRKAAAWEADQMGIGAKVRAAGSTGAASDILTRQFEMPASGSALNAEATKRAILAGKLAINSGASFGGFGSNRGGDRNFNIKTGDITVQTQATDATGVASSIGGALQQQIKMVINAYDDGVAA